MRSKFSLLLPALLLFATVQLAQGKTAPEVLVRKALSANSGESASAIAELRSMGPTGLSLLSQTYANEIERQITDPAAVPTSEWRRLSTALDAVSQQKDSYLSGLYWYTDFGQAKAAARAARKPILSLRLLGKLSEEFSCANSRFFRTVLYPNAEVSKMLRDRFILHWQSVRPAPRVTIDFGDGRKLERTLTGNSIHYILDANGVPIDALPGLYGPAAFLRSLDRIENVFNELATPNRKLAHHRERLNAINIDWVADIQKSGGKIPASIIVVRGTDGKPTAVEVASLAITKMISEATMLKSMTAGAEALGTMSDEATWRKIAIHHLADAKLDARSISLIKRKTQNAFMADGSKRTTETSLANLVNKLEMNIALDTVRNEYLLHPKLHAWLSVNSLRDNLDALNEKVYAELFMTPASDPWLGLFSAETYMALENGGIVR